MTCLLLLLLLSHIDCVTKLSQAKVSPLLRFRFDIEIYTTLPADALPALPLSLSLAKIDMTIADPQVSVTPAVSPASTRSEHPFTYPYTAPVARPLAASRTQSSPRRESRHRLRNYRETAAAAICRCLP